MQTGDTRTEEGELSDAQLADVTGGSGGPANETARQTADRVDHIQSLLADLADGREVSGLKGSQKSVPATPEEQQIAQALGKLIGDFEKSHDLEDKNAAKPKFGMATLAQTDPASARLSSELSRVQVALSTEELKAAKSPAKGQFGIVSEDEAQLLAKIEKVLGQLVGDPSKEAAAKTKGSLPSDNDPAAKTKGGLIPDNDPAVKTKFGVPVDNDPSAKKKALIEEAELKKDVATRKALIGELQQLGSAFQLIQLKDAKVLGLDSIKQLRGG